jgi:hypothetical protein
MNDHLRGRVLAGVPLGERRGMVDFLERAALRIPGECSERGVQFVDHVQEPPVRVERGVARTRARACLTERRLVRHQLAVLEPVHECAVEAEIVDKHEPAGGIERHHVRVRHVLPPTVRACRALVLEHLSRRSEAAIGVDGEHRDGAARVIGGEHVATVGRDTNVGRVLRANVLAVDRGDAPAGGIDRE